MDARFHIQPEPLDELPVILACFHRPWWVAGGWAVDLALGRTTREHEDVEIAVFFDDQQALRHALDGWDLRIPISGELLPWPPGESLDHSRDQNQLWVRRDESSPWSLEILFEVRQGNEWVYRRDPRVTRPASLYGRMAQGLPVVALEVQLLYKAKRRRPKDEHDFAVGRPALSDEGATWLRSALQTAHPGHPWLDAL